MRRSLAIAKLANGHPLVFETDERGNGRYCLDGHQLNPRQARSLIRELGMMSNGEALFEVEPQTWRLP